MVKAVSLGCCSICGPTSLIASPNFLQSKPPRFGPEPAKAGPTPGGPRRAGSYQVLPQRDEVLYKLALDLQGSLQGHFAKELVVVRSGCLPLLHGGNKQHIVLDHCTIRVRKHCRAIVKTSQFPTSTVRGEYTS